MNMVLSICITSYNRPKELQRCLSSIDVKESKKIEIVISEDVSPKREDIRRVINNFIQDSKYRVVPNFNTENLGYDRNLGKLISLATGEYILFCSDDDAFLPNQLDYIINILEQNDHAMLLSSYRSKDIFAHNRKYNHDFIIPPGEKSAIKHLYDGILFSGLIFRRIDIKEIDAERFVNTNYFQIYLLLDVLKNKGGCYIKNSLIDCIGDGENGYGTTELSKFDPLLSNRKSLYSNIRFNQGLIKVIKMFDTSEGTNILKAFEHEYSMKTYRGLSRARKISLNELKTYWKELNKLEITIRFPANAYYYMLSMLGAKVCDQLIKIPKNILFSIRKNAF